MLLNTLHFQLFPFNLLPLSVILVLSVAEN